MNAHKRKYKNEGTEEVLVQIYKFQTKFKRTYSVSRLDLRDMF